MRTSTKVAAICACAALSLTCLAACGGGDAGTSASSSSSSSASSPASSAQPADDIVEGTPLFEFLAAQNPGFGIFDVDFDPEAIAYIQYEHDEQEDIIVSDAEYIKELYDALAKVVVVGEYTSDEMVTDSSSRYFINMKDGSMYGIHFDAGKLVVDKVYYELGNQKPLTSALIDVQNYYDISHNDA